MTQKRTDDELSEQEFESFLAGRSRIARGYERLRELEPPPDLDDAVLREARTAAADRPRRPFWSTWSSRIAAAAVVVAAVGVALQIRPRPEQRSAPAQDVPVADAVAPKTGFAVDAEQEGHGVVTGSASVSEPPEAAAGPPTLPERLQIDPGESGSLSRSRVRMHSLGAPAWTLTDDEGRLVLSRLMVVTPEGRRVEALERRLRTARVNGLGRAQAQAVDEAPRPRDEHVAALARDLEASRAALAGRTPLYTALFERLGRDRDLADPEDQAEIVADFEAASTYAADRSMPTGPSEPPATAQPERQALDPPSPTAWLALIGALGDTGDASAARRELLAFRDAWPGHSLPPEYAELLDE